MTRGSLAKQQEKLVKVNAEIKEQKLKIDQRLGHAIIKELGLKYIELDQVSIQNYAKKISQSINTSLQQN
ncbi:hypothetical protein [Apilactobacillus quenuiae]|uniref:hypothetical protein n=1 Tax=Apilactobacillus quenuiae TaxID=2008377 RepID=UPI000D0185EF|nr:hypothetical protein [Apilactobacillus quenuiae]